MKRRAMPAWKWAIALAALAAGIAPLFAQEQAKIAAAIAAPMAALDRALAEDAQRPAAASDAERLERMGAIDQSWRPHMGRLRLEGLSAEEVREAFAAIVARTEPIDLRHRDEVMAMLPAEGWFSFSAYGRKAAEAAFHIIQHSDLETQLEVLPALERMAVAGEADSTVFAASTIVCRNRRAGRNVTAPSSTASSIALSSIGSRTRPGSRNFAGK